MKSEIKTNVAILSIIIIGGAGWLYLNCENTGRFGFNRGFSMGSCSALDTPLEIIAAWAISCVPVWGIVLGIMYFVKFVRKL